MNRILKYTLISFAVLAVIFFSLKIENLKKYKSANSKETFDATVYAQNFWDEKLPQATENATDFSDFIIQLKLNKEEAFSKFGRILGIAKTHYFMLKGEGTIESVDNEFLLVKTAKNESLKIATDFIFGNAVRDGSGVVSINNFLNMTDFNNVSVAINKLVKENVVAQIKNSAKPGMKIEFIGATELRLENIDVQNIRIIPVSIKLSDEQTNE